MAAPDAWCLRAAFILFPLALVAVYPVTATDAVAEVDENNLDSFVRENAYALVLFYADDDDNREYSDALNEVLKLSESELAVKKIKFGKSKSKELAANYRISTFPSLLFFREKFPVLFDGAIKAEDLMDWFDTAQNSATKILTDENFEHITQAATGATTGDWLVLFYNHDCTAIMAAIEALALRVKHWMNVARVEVDANPNLSKRFQIKEYPTTIYFRLGKMYRYEPNKYDVKSLQSFVESWYKNVKAKPVPGEATAFDRLTEYIALELKTHLEGPNRMAFLVSVLGTSVAVVLLVICCCVSATPRPKKE